MNVDNRKARRPKLFAVVAALAALLLWPALVNGGPFFMSDTPSYIRGADAAIHRLTGQRTIWSGELFKRFGPAAGQAAPAGPADEAEARQEPVVLAGRSIYYGALLYLGQALGSLWFVAVIQALLVACAALLTMLALQRASGVEAKPLTLLGWGAALAILTPAGYFAGYLIPDVFGALTLLAVAHLCFFWKESAGPARGFWTAVLAAALLFHNSNLLIALTLLVLGGLGLALKRAPASPAGLATIFGTLCLAFAGQAMFNMAVARATGEAPVRPPFVAARIIHDGPGYRYLKEHCPQPDLIFCRAAEFEVRHSDLLLWSPDPKVGIFQALPPDQQRLTAAQEMGFVLAVAADRPLDLAASSLRSWLDQLLFLRLVEFNYSSANQDYLSRKLPPPVLEQARATEAFQGTMPVRAVEYATMLLALLSTAAILWLIATSIRAENRVTPIAGFLIFIMLGILVNAAVCGMASMPAGRYEMRLIWILPLTAIGAAGLAFARPGVSRSRNRNAGQSREAAEHTG